MELLPRTPNARAQLPMLAGVDETLPITRAPPLIPIVPGGNRRAPDPRRREPPPATPENTPREDGHIDEYA